MTENDNGFLARWSRRKAAAREARVEPPLPPQPATIAEPGPPPAAPSASAPPAEPPPTLEDVAALTPQSDFARFVAPDVDAAVRGAALKKLFADPRFNVMDGLDVYIDDYGKPDPLSPALLRKMTQSRFLNLFDDDEAPPSAAPALPVTPPVEGPADPCDDPPRDEDPALRLQPHDPAGPTSAEPGAVPDPGRER